MNAPASAFDPSGVDSFDHGGDDLFGHAPGSNAKLPDPAQFHEPKPIAPSFDGFEELSHEVAQRAHELERKAQFGAQVRKEIEQKRKQLHMHMLRLKQEMAELESEMKALETQAKKRKIRQTFGGGVHQDAFSSDAIAEDFGDAFDSFGGDDASSIK
jgi:chromosome segregation ATPase